MVKIIMHGCNGHMGQVISGLVEKDPDAEIVAGIDVADQGKNSYPVYTNMEECQVEADALIDFSSAKATDALLAYCEKRKLPVVLCTTGLSEEQLAKVEETSKNVAVLKSARGSMNFPKFVTRLYFLASFPSNQSVTLATTKIASAI